MGREPDRYQEVEMLIEGARERRGSAHAARQLEEAEALIAELSLCEDTQGLQASLEKVRRGKM